jgi:hypothetical protein
VVCSFISLAALNSERVRQKGGRISFRLELDGVSFSDTPREAGRSICHADMRLVDYEDLTYPAPARTAHVRGDVVGRAEIDGRGGVVDAAAVSGAQILIRDCLANVRKWRFQSNAQRAAVIILKLQTE